MNTFLGLDLSVDAQYRETGATAFVPDQEDGEEIGRIYFSADIYPGPDVVDPNSALSMKAAAAHELSHFHRWHDQTQLPDGVHRDLDEALTSLDAALRYDRDLSRHELLQLVRDAVHRLQRLKKELLSDAGGDGHS